MIGKRVNLEEVLLTMATSGNLVEGKSDLSEVINICMKKQELLKDIPESTIKLLHILVNSSKIVGNLDDVLNDLSNFIKEKNSNLLEKF